MTIQAFIGEPFIAVCTVKRIDKRGFAFLDFDINGPTLTCILRAKNFYAPHFCMLMVGDVVDAVIQEKTPGRFDAFQARPNFDIEGFPRWEISEVTYLESMDGNRIRAFGKRQGCGCQILLFVRDDYQGIQVGDYIRHKTVQNKAGRWHGEQLSQVSAEDWRGN